MKIINLSQDTFGLYNIYSFFNLVEEGHKLVKMFTYIHLELSNISRTQLLPCILNDYVPPVVSGCADGRELFIRNLLFRAHIKFCLKKQQM